MKLRLTLMNLLIIYTLPPSAPSVKNPPELLQKRRVSLIAIKMWKFLVIIHYHPVGTERQNE